MRGAAVVAACVLAAAAGGAWALSREEPFPHLRHEGLFPTCTGCHAGIPGEDDAPVYPPAAACAACHDGETLPTVTFSPPTSPRVSNLDFSHPGHARAVAADGDAPPECAACHRPPAATARMDVVAASPEACLACHEAPSHLAEGRECGYCHTSLTGSPDLGLDRVDAFPRPESHESPAFALTHDPGGDVDRCATCHARESCTRCHLNGDALAPVRALQPDPRAATLAARRPPRYPEPPDHRSEGWSYEHGEATGDFQSCGNCHVQESCRSCHVDSAPGAVTSLPVPAEGDPRGVREVDAGSVHWPGWASDHGIQAAAEGACSSCHRPAFCESCHAGADTPPFHLADFLERHGAEAYSAGTDCSSCHSTEVFCRTCHTGLGMGDGRGAGVTIHTSRPFWLLGHGTAARQGLEGCVTCHDQGDCATCHSATTGWRVNPHGPSFDPARARDANPFSCARCHRGGGA